MVELGLGNGGAAKLSPPKKQTRRPTEKRQSKPREAPPAEGARRSKRSRGEKPDYTGEQIDKFGEDLDRVSAASR